MTRNRTPPDFISELGVQGDDPHEWKSWFMREETAMRKKGGTWFRYAHTPDAKRFLIEGWKVKPDDEGEPRFSDTVKLV